MIQPTPGPSSSTREPSAGPGVGEQQLEEDVAPVGGPAASCSSGDAVVDPLVQAVQGARTHPGLLVALRIHLCSSISDDKCWVRDAYRSNPGECAAELGLDVGGADRWSCSPTCGSTSPTRTSASRSGSRAVLVSAEEAGLPPRLRRRRLSEVPDRARRAVLPRTSTTTSSRIWEERPADLAVSPPGSDGPTAVLRLRRPRPRRRATASPICTATPTHALDLYLHPTMFRMVELIYDQPAIAFQSLYFEYGSQQALHRDPMFVVTDPAVAPAGVVGRARGHRSRERAARVRAEVASLAVVRVRARHGGVRPEGPPGEARGVRRVEARR